MLFRSFSGRPDDLPLARPEINFPGQLIDNRLKQLSSRNLDFCQIELVRATGVSDSEQQLLQIQDSLSAVAILRRLSSSNFLFSSADCVLFVTLHGDAPEVPARPTVRFKPTPSKQLKTNRKTSDPAAQCRLTTRRISWKSQVRVGTGAYLANHDFAALR